MERSLSVVLPVYNAEKHLAALVHDLLDVLPDLTPRFEVLIVDDGSTDHTIEIADQLQTEYPQCRVSRHSRRLGLPSALQTGLAQCRHELVILHDSKEPFRPGDLRRLWSLRGDSDLVVARVERSHASAVKPPASSAFAPLSRPARQPVSTGLQLLHRRALQSPGPSLRDEEVWENW